MKSVLVALIALMLTAAAASADTVAAKKKHGARDHGRPAAKAQAGGGIRDIDETRYYERLSEKIPFGSGTWWRQKQLENPTP
jgi:hypothetical protein